MSSDTLSAVGLQPLKPASAANAASQRAAVDSPAQPASLESGSSSPAAPPAVDAVKASAEQIETYLNSSGRQLEFRVDDGSGQLVVSVRDASTGELIRQIPGDDVLRMARTLKENPVSLINLTV